MGLYLEAFGSTNAGKVRKNNEDSLLTGEGRDEALFAVADGIGGFEAGEVASRIAIGVLGELEPTDSLEEAVREANRRILAAARGDEKLSGMGTTVVAARFSVRGEGARGGASAEISHVGDSRAYLLRGGEVAPVTEDHSLVAELVRSGDLTRAQASEHPQKNLITRALGAEDDVQVDTAVLPIQPEDRILLCSDGLTDMVPEAKVGELLAAPSPEEAARALVKAALDAGGADNVTVVVVDVKEEPSGAPRTDTQEMRALPPDAGAGAVEAPERRGRRGGAGRKGPSAKARSRQRKGRSAPVRLLTWIVRAVAAILVLAALASPFYLWGSSRHYLGFDSGEVVIYRGLPEEYTLGYTLNEELRRTDLRESEVGETYRQPIETHKLYSSREDAERVVRNLEDRRTGREGR